MPERFRTALEIVVVILFSSPLWLSLACWLFIPPKEQETMATATVLGTIYSANWVMMAVFLALAAATLLILCASLVRRLG